MNAAAAVVTTPTNPNVQYTPQPAPACVTSLTQYASPAGYSGQSNWATSITPYATCNVPSGFRYCGISAPMNFATPANGGTLCPGKYNAYGYCLQNTAGGCGGSSCGWGVVLYGLSSDAQYGSSGTQLSTSGSVTGCTHNHGNPCENSTVTLQTNTFTYDTNVYTNVYMEDTSESAASTGICVVVMTQTQAY